MQTLDLTAHWAGIASLIIFVLAYVLVIFEEATHLRKSKPVMLAAGLIWGGGLGLCRGDPDASVTERRAVLGKAAADQSRYCQRTTTSAGREPSMTRRMLGMSLLSIHARAAAGDLPKWAQRSCKRRSSSDTGTSI